jgi:hypothetical protein
LPATASAARADDPDTSAAADNIPIRNNLINIAHLQ